MNATMNFRVPKEAGNFLTQRLLVPEEEINSNVSITIRCEDC